MRLSDFARNEHSQFGEDGMIQHIFDHIGEQSRTCVEFGASDGSSCANTRRLWEAGWSALLIEGDPERFDVLQRTVVGISNVKTLEAYVAPTTIDMIVTHDVDFMSIDVDGIDYDIFEAMKTRPRVICIEYNQSIPPHVSVRSAELGSSAKALVELAQRKQYQLVGMNKANLFFVVDDEAESFDYLERELSSLFIWEGMSYLCTDYQGRYFAVGTPPWGISRTPFPDPVEGDEVQRFAPDVTGMLGLHYLHLVKAFESEAGYPALFIGQDWQTAPTAPTRVGEAAYTKLFERQAPLVIVDVANQVDVGGCLWVARIAAKYGYKLRIIGRELFVFNLGAA